MSEDFVASINIFLAPIIGLLLILFDIRQNRGADAVLRRLMSYATLYSLGSLSCELLYEAFKGSSWTFAHPICWIANTLYFFFQVMSFGYVTLFLDYSAHQNPVRLSKLRYIVNTIWGINALTLAINLSNSFMFTITPDNYYLRGEYYAIRLVTAYAVMFLAVVNLAVSRKHLSRNLLVLGLIAALPASIGSALDLIVPGLRLIWPCYYISLLFCYLFVMRMNTVIDSLTGVYNRRGCDDYLHTLSKSSRRSAYAFIMIDMDKFKDINDQFGHAQGDCALRDVADILRTSVRRSDFVARYGGDEFVIIAATEEADKIIEHVSKQLHDFNDRKSRPYTLQFSCGGSIYLPGDARSADEFLSYVDAMMYKNKEERRRSNLSASTAPLHPIPLDAYEDAR